MSKIIASAAIRGAHKITKQAQEILTRAIKEKGEDCRVEFPNTGYFIPIIYSMTGRAVEKLADFKEVMDEINGLLSPPVDDDLWVPYLGQALDAGMATLFAEEIIEACKYLIGPNPVNDIWLGAADDVILRERGIQFVDGTAPGFAAIAGAAPDVETAVNIARKLQERCLYVFMSAHNNSTTFAEQLFEGGVQLGWETRLVPFGREITSAIYSLGFASRAALSFGGVQPGDFKRNLLYNKNRIFAFVLALGEVTDEWYATAAGAINYGFPTIADSDIPEILPTGVCTYEHVVSQIPHNQIVEKAIEVRGLKIKITEIPIPVSVSPAFEGERIRKEDMQCEFGGQRTPAFEWLRMRDISEVEDGNVEVIGPDIDSVEAGGKLPLGIIAEVAGRKMQDDFEPVLERQIHTFINEAQGIWHMGQRDINWVRISKDAAKAGFMLEHIGKLLHAKYHDEYSNIVDKVQVKIYTDEKQVVKLREQAQAIFAERDARLAGMQDEDVETFYSCTLCQSFAPNHVCVVSPERPGLCGAYSWLDCRAAYEITPSGPNQPISKGNMIEPTVGQWDKINAFVLKASGNNIERMSQYSMIVDPMTSCGCFECIAAVLPSTGGIMIVNREFTEMTPCGMKFSTLAGTVGGGQQTPGFIGHSKHYINSKKFIAAEGGIQRIAWMPTMLKEEIMDTFIKRADEVGLGGKDFLDKIADETTATTEEEVLEFITKNNHPVTALEPMF
ncbi:MAG: CO dehydrogenase/CO-methylating acetyl-CoA synthase complex subunit beta [Sedimentisphaerales bacterium]|nr:CO dehydrogenase/CO-methylating acetyl-CoA synthase complex subunit beta [Sedimentisphaerales bacterium]